MKALTADDIERILNALKVDQPPDGYHEFVFENGVVYRGEFLDGRFHGDGVMVFSLGSVSALWVKGVPTQVSMTFEDGLNYVDQDDWGYCLDEDQRLQSEIMSKQPLTDPVRLYNDPSIRHPFGTYFVGYGYLDVHKKSVFSLDGKFLHNADADFCKWAVDKCAISVEKNQPPLHREYVNQK